MKFIYIYIPWYLKIGVALVLRGGGGGLGLCYAILYPWAGEERLEECVKMMGDRMRCVWQCTPCYCHQYISPSALRSHLRWSTYRDSSNRRLVDFEQRPTYRPPAQVCRARGSTTSCMGAFAEDAILCLAEGKESISRGERGAPRRMYGKGHAATRRSEARREMRDQELERVRALQGSPSMISILFCFSGGAKKKRSSVCCWHRSFRFPNPLLPCTHSNRLFLPSRFSVEPSFCFFSIMFYC